MNRHQLANNYPKYQDILWETLISSLRLLVHFPRGNIQDVYCSLPPAKMLSTSFISVLATVKTLRCPAKVQMTGRGTKKFWSQRINRKFQLFNLKLSLFSKIATAANVNPANVHCLSSVVWLPDPKRVHSPLYSSLQPGQR